MLKGCSAMAAETKAISLAGQWALELDGGGAEGLLSSSRWEAPDDGVWITRMVLRPRVM
jgi:hypothetical protein